ncbi:MAG: hypothetical protein ACFFCQ_10615 [Promethearchaeota archaeon]
MSFEKVKSWLDQMELRYSHNEEMNLFYLPYDISGTKFAVQIGVFDEKWIKIAALIVQADMIPKGLLRALLNANWHLFDVTYSIDDNGNVFSENDVPVDSNFENFRSEFGAVVFGVTHFFDTIANKLNVEQQDTYVAKPGFEYV